MFPESTGSRSRKSGLSPGDNMLHSGIDLHKRTIAIATVTPEGQPVRDTQLPTSRTAIRAYIDARAAPRGGRIHLELVLAPRPARRRGG